MDRRKFIRGSLATAGGALFADLAGYSAEWKFKPVGEPAAKSAG